MYTSLVHSEDRHRVVGNNQNTGDTYDSSAWSTVKGKPFLCTGTQ